MSPKKILILLALLPIGCASLPKVPRHVQYGAYPQVNPPGFYGVDNESHERHYLEFTSPVMRGGQCLTASDYKSWSKWVSAVKAQAEKRCR